MAKIRRPVPERQIRDILMHPRAKKVYEVGFGQPIESCDFLWDSGGVIVCGAAYGLALVDSKRQVTHVSTEPYRLVCTDRKRQLYLASLVRRGRPVIDVFEKGSNRIVRSFVGHEQEINSLHIGRQGRIYSIDGDGVLIQWNINGEILTKSKFDSGLRSDVTSSPEGNLAVMTFEDVTLLKAKENKILRSYHKNEWTLASVIWSEHLSKFVVRNDNTRKTELITASSEDNAIKTYVCQTKNTTAHCSVKDIIVVANQRKEIIAVSLPENSENKIFQCDISPQNLSFNSQKNLLYIVCGNFSQGKLICLKIE